jgi:hypothetical protein
MSGLAQTASAGTYCPFTRKNAVVFVMGRFVLLALVVTMSLHEPAGNTSVRCTT